MSTSSASTNSTIPAVVGSAAVQSPVSDELFVRVKTGGMELALRANDFTSISKMTSAQLSNDPDEIDGPDGPIPVFSLGEQLHCQLGMKTESWDDERTLISVEHDGQTAMLRVESASNPSKVRDALVRPFPEIGAAGHTRGLINAVVNTNPSEEDPALALRLIFNPLAIMGVEIAPPKKKPAKKAAPKKAPKKVAKKSDQDTEENSKSNQLLAFVPGDVIRDIDHVFCLPLAAVAEVCNVYETINTDIESDVFKGYAVWRKIPVPVVNLGAIFGIADSAEQVEKRARERGRRLIIARVGADRLIGFYAQAQMQSMKVPAAIPVEIEAMKNLPVLGSFNTDFAKMVVPDLSSILDNNFGE